MFIQIQVSLWLLPELVGVSVTGDTIELFFKALPTESQEFIFESTTVAQEEAKRIVGIWTTYLNITNKK